MSFKVKDIVKLTKENHETRQNGIKVGQIGIVVKTNFLREECQVVFLDFDNNRAYEIITLKNDMLERQVTANLDVNGDAFCYLDEVELVSDKYKSQGVKKNSKGVVVMQEGIGKSMVDFTQIKGKELTGAVITVQNKDLKKI